MIYLIIVNIALLISFGLYHLCFRKLTFFQWNRMYLIGSILLALLIPIGLFIDLSDILLDDEILPTIYLGEMIDFPIIYMESGNPSYYLMDIVKPIYWVGVGIMFLVLSYRLYLIRDLFQKENSFLSFSFFNKVFLGKGLKSKEVIESHERVHVEQGHSYDIVLIELVKIFNWFNPIVYFMAKELKFQHECIADEICSEDRVAYAELLVANALRVDRSALVHEFSNQSFLKKRIMMLFKKKSSNKKKLFYLSTIPMLVIVAGSTLVFNTSKAKEIVNTIEQKIEDVTLPEKAEQMDVRETSVKLPDVLEETIILTPDQQDTTNKTKDETVFSSVEINPEPPGGMSAYIKWISENYNFPEEAIDAGVKGTIQTSFIVEKDGSMSDIKAVRDLDYGTGEAAVNLLKSSPKWSPGIQNGKAVRVAYVLPIRIDLTTGEEVNTKEISNLPLATPELGYVQLRKWLNRVYKLPRAITKSDADPIVSVSFDVNQDGTIGNSMSGKSELGVQFVTELNKHLKQTNWRPAVVDGEKKKSRGYLHIKFAPNGHIIEDYTRVEILPEPKGGVAALHNYLKSKITFPSDLANEGKSVFIVNFVVEKEGNIVLAKDGGKISKDNNDKLISSVTADAFKQLQDYGKWAPAIIDGQKVSVKYALGIIFDKGEVKTTLHGGEFIKSSLL